MSSSEDYAYLREHRPDVFARVVNIAHSVTTAPPGTDALKVAAWVEKAVAELVVSLLRTEDATKAQIAALQEPRR